MGLGLGCPFPSWVSVGANHRHPFLSGKSWKATYGRAGGKPLPFKAEHLYCFERKNGLVIKPMVEPETGSCDAVLYKV